MTELQFLIKLLLDSPLDQETKRLVADRIREVEGKLSSSSIVNVVYDSSHVHEKFPQAQAPSMQRILRQNPDINAFPNNPLPAPIPQPVIPVPRGVIDKETGTERIPTGNGTQGPRKWK